MYPTRMVLTVETGSDDGCRRAQRVSKSSSDSGLTVTEPTEGMRWMELRCRTTTSGKVSSATVLAIGSGLLAGEVVGCTCCLGGRGTGGAGRAAVAEAVMVAACVLVSPMAIDALGEPELGGVVEMCGVGSPSPRCQKGVSTQQSKYQH